MRQLERAVCLALLSAGLPAPTYGQTVTELQARIDAQDARIRELEAKLQQLIGSGVVPMARPAAEQGEATAKPAATIGALAPAASPAVPAASRLALSGDLRTRYELNFGDNDVRDRGRGVLRARLRAAYAATDWLTVGGQIATGDPDDPNSADITLGNFDDDLDVSLDQAYLKGSFAGGKLTSYLGKMPQPFVRTELVWDGDVSPQGASAAYRMPLADGTITATGLYFLVDESVAGPDSDMVGVQVGYQSPSSTPLRFEGYVGYYDYALRRPAGGDAGDFRSNRLVAGRYLSDFDLLDVIGAVSWSGLGPRWPVKLMGDYVHNFGAADEEDSGFGVDVLVGNASAKGDWRFGYGYAEAEADAVLAAFSQDNTGIATNYLQHSFTIDYVPTRNVILNATLYHYRPKSPFFAGPNATHDWLDRLRLNLLVNF